MNIEAPPQIKTLEPQRLCLGICACPPVAVGAAVVDLLSRQPGISLTVEARPLLPWSDLEPERLKARLGRFRKSRPEQIIVDWASFYLPHIATILAMDSAVQVLHLSMPPEEAASTLQWLLDQATPLPYHHWSEESTVDGTQDPEWSQTFPKYAGLPLRDALRRYCAEYEAAALALHRQFPDRVRTIDYQELMCEAGVGRLLDHLGVGADGRQVVLLDVTKPSTMPSHPRLQIRGRPLNDPARCVILVPYYEQLVPETEAALRKLETIGYTVRRQPGVSAIDQGRSQMATEALCDGFDELFWIDSDVVFDDASVDRIRAWNLPICSGLYSKKGGGSFASAFLAGAKGLEVGEGGGLAEILYAATGFFACSARSVPENPREASIAIVQ